MSARRLTFYHVRIVAGVKPYYSLTPEQADLVRVVAELEEAGIVASYRVLAEELDCSPTNALRMAQGAAERGWVILPRFGVPGVQVAPGAPLHRLFGSLKEHDLAITGAGVRALFRLGGVVP